MLETRALRFSYSGDVTFKYPDIYSDRKHPLLICGRSGTGKTTLLHLLGCILKPDDGSISIDGKNVSQLKNRELDRFRGLNTGIVYQRPHFMAALTVIDNIVMSQYFSGSKISLADARTLATRLNISHLLNKLPNQLSQGEQQRVSIARAMLNKPALLLADEPTSSLDDDNCNEVIKLLQEQSDLQGSALVIVTHDERLKKYFKNIITLA